MGNLADIYGGRPRLFFAAKAEECVKADFVALNGTYDFWLLAMSVVLGRVGDRSPRCRLNVQSNQLELFLLLWSLAITPSLI